MCLTFQTKENPHPTPTQSSIQIQKLAQTEATKLKLEQLSTYLHLPGESVINGEDCHRGDPKAGHNSCHEVSEPLGPLFGQFLFHSCRHNSRFHFLFFLVCFDLEVPFGILREDTDGEATRSSGPSKPKDCALTERC